MILYGLHLMETQFLIQSQGNSHFRVTYILFTIDEIENLFGTNQET